MYESGAVGKMIDLLTKHSKDEDVDNNVVCVNLCASDFLYIAFSLWVSIFIFAF